MNVPRLWRSGSVCGVRGQGVAFQNNHVIEVIGERPRRREPAHSSADHDGPFADQS